MNYQPTSQKEEKPSRASAWSSGQKLRVCTALIAVAAARPICKAIIPEGANYLWRLWGGGLVAGLLAAALWFAIVSPLSRRLAGRRKA
jgi:hypothetical protein